MLEVAAQIIICLILAALLGGIIGYLLGRVGCNKQGQCYEKKENTHELHIDQNGISSTTKATTLMADTATKVEEDASAGIQPVLLTEAREGGKDNLQLIKGVGKVLEKVLNETGIYHFDQIANLTKEEVSWLDNSMSFPGRIEREAWVAQAKDLAAGVQTEFAQRVERGEVATSKKSDA